MDIDDAFTQEAINSSGMNVEGEEERELRTIIRNIYESNELEHDLNAENIAVLSFVAGRVYQADQNGFSSTVTVPMSGELVGEFIEFLRERHD